MQNFFQNLGFVLSSFVFSGEGKNVFFFYVKKLGLATFLLFTQILINSYSFPLALDFVTPILIYFVITSENNRSFLLCFYFSLILEGFSFFPFGFYFCSYFSLWLFSTAVRDYVCWQNFYTWFSFIFFGTIWALCMELFLTFIKIPFFWDFETAFYFLSLVVIRFFIALIVLYFLAFRGLLVLSGERL